MDHNGLRVNPYLYTRKSFLHFLFSMPDVGEADSDKYLQEIERLKSFLLQLDEEINDDTKRTQETIQDLETRIADRDRIIEELQGSEEIVEHLQDENMRLKEIIQEQERTIVELSEKNNNLQTALVMLQTSEDCVMVNVILVDVQEEISMGLLESKRRLMEAEKKTEEAYRRLSLKDTGSVDEEVVRKLVKDLDGRNFLIDQLNEEVNLLREQITNMLKGDTIDGRDGSIDK